MSDCFKCYGAICTCGDIEDTSCVSIEKCKDCYYAVNDATTCELHTVCSEDGEIFPFDITPEWFCGSFKRKEK